MLQCSCHRELPLFQESSYSQDLGEFWFVLRKEEIAPLMGDQRKELGSMLMSIPFPAGGSIYYAEDMKYNVHSLPAGGNIFYAEDLKNELGHSGIPLDGPFCIGPDVSIPLWYGWSDWIFLEDHVRYTSFFYLFLTRQ